MNTRTLLCALVLSLAAPTAFGQDGGATPPRPGPEPGAGPGAQPADPMETLRRLFKQVIRHMGRAEQELGRASAPDAGEDKATVERIREENDEIAAALDEMEPPEKTSPRSSAPKKSKRGGDARAAGNAQARTLKTIDELMKAIQGEQKKSSETIKKLIQVAEKMTSQQSSSGGEPKERKPGEKDKNDDQLTQMPQDKNPKEQKEPGQPPEKTPPSRPREKTRRRRDGSAWIARLPEKEVEELARAKRPEALKKWNRATEKYTKDLSERAKDER